MVFNLQTAICDNILESFHKIITKSIKIWRIEKYIFHILVSNLVIILRYLSVLYGLSIFSFSQSMLILLFIYAEGNRPGTYLN